MATQQEQLQQVQDFLRSHRSNEANFEAISQKLDEALAGADEATPLHQDLKETKEKYAAAYATARANNATAWPKFENFISHFERSLVAAMNGGA